MNFWGDVGKSAHYVYLTTYMHSLNVFVFFSHDKITKTLVIVRCPLSIWYILQMGHFTFFRTKIPCFSQILDCPLHVNHNCCDSGAWIRIHSWCKDVRFEFSALFTDCNLYSTPSFFSYFTYLSYIGMCAYFWAAATQTIAFAIESNGSYPLQRWPKFLQAAHSILWSTVTAFGEWESNTLRTTVLIIMIFP